MTELEPLLSARQVADLFGLTLRTLSNWERAGTLVPLRRRSRRYYRRSDVEALLGIDKPKQMPLFPEFE